MNIIPWRSKSREGETELAPPRDWFGGYDWLPMSRFWNEMDRMFERTFGREFAGDFDMLTPALDVSETDKEVTIQAELPGVNAKDVDVSVSGNMLTIAGEKKEEHEKKDAGYQRRERRYGSFRRTISLPKGVDPDSIAAEYSNGVLTVRLQKSEQYLPKKVPVKALEQK